MAIISTGALADQTAAVGAASASGLHVVAKPQAYDVGGNPTYGHYQVAQQTGAMAAGAATYEVFQFYWSDATRLALIQRIWITGMRATTAFAAGSIDIKATMASSWTVAGTGGTALTLTSPEFKLRQPAMGATLATDIRIATTAALGAGTKTFNAQDLGQITTHSSAGWNSATPIIGSIYLPTNDLFSCNIGSGEHPIVLTQSTGFGVRVTVPATGVWNIGIGVKWSEVAFF